MKKLRHLQAKKVSSEWTCTGGREAPQASRIPLGKGRTVGMSPFDIRGKRGPKLTGGEEKGRAKTKTGEGRTDQERKRRGLTSLGSDNQVSVTLSINNSDRWPVHQ